MTYHTQYPALGYVQGTYFSQVPSLPQFPPPKAKTRLTGTTGMSDLLSPIYIVFDNNEADAYWGLVGVMRMMASLPRRYV